ncbi:MAG: tRNA lysidine(34) synthetase TilS [Flavobacteriaceae bacterium]
MLERFQKQLQERFSYLTGKRLLLAVSGGIDSMVLVSLMQKSDSQLGLAHVNFGLRGDESDADEIFVQNYAQQHQLPFYSQKFETEVYANNNGISIQMAARVLRYDWFAELLEQEAYDYVLTAHQADDVLETFIINLSRGTGIDGLCGIPEQNGKIIRPLLAFGRDEILKYAQDEQLAWREDSSNASDQYLRNQIRHHLVPELKNLSTDFLPAFQNTLAHLQQTRSLAEDAAAQLYSEIIESNGNQLAINLTQLLEKKNYQAYLYSWLQSYGFSAWQDIYDLCFASSGKQVFSKDYGLLKDRDCLILYPLTEASSDEIYNVSMTEGVNFPLKISISQVADIQALGNSVIFVDADKIHFPLSLRRWQNGDVFYPLGMNGQSKKVSKYFKDERLSLLEKQNAWLLCSGDAVVWIVNYRADERFKVSGSTQKILKITLHS